MREGAQLVAFAGLLSVVACSDHVTIGLDLGRDASAGAGALHIEPPNPVVDIRVVDGDVTAVQVVGAGTGAISFRAIEAGGRAVPAQWGINRGEVGAIATGTGELTLSGRFGGVARISASFDGALATTTVTVRLHMSQNGKPRGDGSEPEAGPGGPSGVGGEGFGPALDDATILRLQTPSAPPADSALGWLYPYEGTVWPRGILAPLLQWSSGLRISAVRVHLQQQNFDFDGYYGGQDLVREPVDPAAWKAALSGNGGDRLNVELTVADGNDVYAPISEGWLVAPGALKGTVYYDSYNTALAQPDLGQQVAAAVLAIRPGASSPTLALPGAKNQCIACHTVSDDGSTMFAQTGVGEDYKDGASYDLTRAGARIQSYTGVASDGSTNDRKFLWAALAQDGTYALQSAGHTQEAYAQAAPGTRSRIFRRDDGNAMPATGFDDAIEEAVTPAFSRDGKRVAFDYWTGTLPPGGGDGHTLDIMDFACGTPGASTPGAPSCGTFSFSNLRRLYTNPDADNGYVVWPAWLPDGKGIVFHNVVVPSVYHLPSSKLATWHGAKGQIWFVDVPDAPETPAQAVPLRALNGIDESGTSVLPKHPLHPEHDDDSMMNYEPTVTPIASGGYYWVVFTSRRAYGNVAEGDPYDTGDGVKPIPKKIWVSAVDLSPTPGQDPSHPAFYLPGQELAAANMRAFWVVDPCHADGTTCETGDECCNGYCRLDNTGGLVCAGSGNTCAQEFERCAVDSDCCGASLGFFCINGFCSQSSTTAR